MIDEWMYAEGDFDVNFTKKRELSLTDFEKKLLNGFQNNYSSIDDKLLKLSDKFLPTFSILNISETD